MKLSAQEITEYSKSLGLDDIKFARANGDITLLRGGRAHLSSILDTVTCMIVLFKSYHPSFKASVGKIAVSQYYIASNSAYHAANELKRYINESGARALLVSDISAREAALRTGGFIGDNGFYYHNKYGSLVCIQVILTDAVEPLEYDRGESRCLHCSICAKECPSGAVTDIRNCLRKYINGLVPGHLRSDVYQLFGCEKCQSACPLNSLEKSITVEADLKELLGGDIPDELKSYVGINMARRIRILSQAALYAGSVKNNDVARLLEALLVSSEESVKTHAAWALERLKNDKT